MQKKVNVPVSSLWNTFTKNEQYLIIFVVAVTTAGIAGYHIFK